MRAEPSALRTTVTREEEITVTSAENPPPVTARAADPSMRIAARADNERAVPADEPVGTAFFSLFR